MMLCQGLPVFSKERKGFNYLHFTETYDFNYMNLVNLIIFILIPRKTSLLALA